MKKNDIYSQSSNGSFFSPFSLKIDDMECLILVNFEKDPDKFYNILELQKAPNKNGNKSFLVIAYRKDGTADVYHQATFPFASQASILNDVNFFISPLESTKFEVNTNLLEVFFEFKDKIGREIKVKITESKRRKKKPFFLLAPVGVVSRKPTSFPVYSLYEMSFIKRKYSDIEIEIDKVKHKPDTFPLPIDCSKNYFTRYSPDTFNVDWNKNFDGSLLPLIPDKSNRIEDKGITYDLVDNDGHYEIMGMNSKNKKHQINFIFSPPIPDFVCLKNEIVINGIFTITTEESTGKIKGRYSIQRLENEIEMKFQPNGGWQPNERRWPLKFLFLVVKVFREWPKSYIWNAKIKLDAINPPKMNSIWNRI